MDSSQKFWEEKRASNQKTMPKKLKRPLLILLYLFHWRTLIWYVQWPYYEIRYWIKHHSRDKDEESLQDEPKEWSRILDELQSIWKESPPWHRFSTLFQNSLSSLQIFDESKLSELRGHKNWLLNLVEPDGEQKPLINHLDELSLIPRFITTKNNSKDGNFTDHPDCRFFILDLESGEGFPGKTYWDQRNPDTAQTGTSRDQIRSIQRRRYRLESQAFWNPSGNFRNCRTEKSGNFGTEKETRKPGKTIVDPENFAEHLRGKNSVFLNSFQLLYGTPGVIEPEDEFVALLTWGQIDAVDKLGRGHETKPQTGGTLFCFP